MDIVGTPAKVTELNVEGLIEEHVLGLSRSKGTFISRWIISRLWRYYTALAD